MKLEDIIRLDKKYYMNTFGNRTPVCFEYGKGMFLWDTEGKRYYDFLAGIAVSALGHSHPRLVEAIKSQAEKFIHCTNLYYIRPQSELARLLAENSCADRVFFCNSGAEANEGAIKLARLYYRKKGFKDKYEIITLEKSFHGRTLATVAATGQRKYREPLEPLTPSFKTVPANSLESIESAITGNTCAIMIEPVQGEGGVNLLDAEYVRQLRKICDEKNILLIFDEIQTGIGRTGKLFGYMHFGVEPDIFTLAKALGGGFPIGAICAKEEVSSAFGPGDHGSTFGGNPLACAAALAVMETVLGENLAENAEQAGKYLMEKLGTLKDKYPALISEVRGRGLMIGVQFTADCAAPIKDKCFEKGFLVGTAGANILRILPPLIVTEKDIDALIDAIDEVLKEI